MLFQLSGLEGMGKTTIVDHLRERLGKDAVATISDSWMEFDRVERDIDHARTTAKGMIADTLFQDDHAEQLRETLKRKGMKTEIVPLHSLGTADYLAMAEERGLQLTEQDIAVLEKFSLGIPFVADRILADGTPISAARAELYLTAYACSLEGYISSEGKRASRLVQEHLGKTLPDEVLTSPSLRRGSALARVRLEQVEHGIPRCPDTLRVYDEWIRREAEQPDNNTLSLFVPDVQDADGLAHALGVEPTWFEWQNGSGAIKQDSRLRTLCPMMRKFALGLGNHFMATEYHQLAAEIYDRDLRQHQIGSCEWTGGLFNGRLHLTLAKDVQPFFLMSAAHFGDMNNQPQLGLGTQSALEHLGIPFRLRLGSWKAFDYEPQQNVLVELREHGKRRNS